MGPRPRIKTATDLSLADLRAGMLAAFADYAVPMQPSAAAFAFMMRQRGLDPDASRVALVGDAVAAIWLVALRGDASYLIASGTRPEDRGKGLARRLAFEAGAALRVRGARQLRTEVLEGNEVAIRLYRSLGLTVARHLDCYDIAVGDTDAEPGVASVSWAVAEPALSAFRDWSPTWQNDDASLRAVAEEVRAFAVRESGDVVAAAAVVPRTGALAQIAVRQDRRRRGLGTRLLRAAAGVAPESKLRLVNAQADDHGLASFLQTNWARRTTGQYELVGPLAPS